MQILRNGSKNVRFLKLALISDSHLSHEETYFTIPPADILIHAGDALAMGTMEELRLFVNWFKELPHRIKVFCAGNHDWPFQRKPDEARTLLSKTGCIYLQDSEATVEGLRIYGAPWTPRFFNWAFQKDRGPDIRERWEQIPKDLDVLVTHGPPFGYGDQLKRGLRVGCEDLVQIVEDRKPRLHVFGHVHEGQGVYSNQDTKFVNAAMVDNAYFLKHKPIVLEMGAE
jgi:Icc-related predicted phosphoesterase